MAPVSIRALAAIALPQASADFLSDRRRAASGAAFESSKTFVSRLLKPRLFPGAFILSAVLSREFPRSYLEKRRNRNLPAARLALQFGLDVDRMSKV